MLTSSSLAVFLVEFVKSLAKKVSGNPDFEFPPKLLAVLLVIANSVAALILATLGVEGYEFPTDWTGWVKNLVLAMLGALVTSALYTVGYIPFKFWAQDYYVRLQSKFLKSNKKSK